MWLNALYDFLIDTAIITGIAIVVGIIILINLLIKRHKEKTKNKEDIDK